MTNNSSADFNNTEASLPLTNLEQLSVNNLLININNEDAKVHLAIKEALPQIEKLINEILIRVKKGGRIFYLGAGTSGRLGVLDASEIAPTFGITNLVFGLIAGGDKALRNAVEAAEDNANAAWEELTNYNVSELDTVIGIAASGTTQYVTGGIALARKNGLLTGCITCNPNSIVAQLCEFPIEINTGAEIIAGSTRLKAGTAQKMVLNMITTTIMIKMGRVKGNKMVHMQLSNQKLVNRGIKMLMDELHINKEEAMALLQKFGSVKKALDSYT